MERARGFLAAYAGGIRKKEVHARVNVYETIVILNADMPDDDVNAYVQRMADIITGDGGEVLKTDPWGRRKMSYEVNKQTKGNYTLLTHQSPSQVVKKLEDLFKVSDQVVKFMNVRLEKKQSAAVLRALKDAEAAAAAAEAAPAEVAPAEATAAAAEAAPAAE